MKHVAAAIIFNDKNELLICQRQSGGSDKSCAGLWEFPGGKLELGESLKECCVRECREELNADIKILSLYEETSYIYPESEIQFTFYLAKLLSDENELKMNVHQKICWVKISELNEYEFCPADIKLIERIKSENE